MQGVALFEPVAERSPASECLFERGDSFVVLIGQVALLRAALEQVRPLGRRQAIAEAKRPRVLCGSLTVCPERAARSAAAGAKRAPPRRRRPPPRDGRAAQDPVHRPADPRAPREPSMQLDPPVRCDRFFDDEPRELVPERDGGSLGREHARGQALLEGVERLAGERLEQPELGLLRHDRDRVEEPRRGRAEPRRRGRSTRPAPSPGTRRPGGEHLDDEERVSGGLPIELVSVDAVRLGQPRDRLERQWRQPAAG